MRELARFASRADADTLAAALVVQGVEVKVSDNPRADDAAHTLWVIDEADMAEAKQTLARFEADPGASEFEAAQAKAKELARAQKDTRAPQVVSMRSRWKEGEGGTGPVTALWLALMAFVFILTFPGIPEQMGTTHDAIVGQLLYETRERKWELVLGYFTDIKSGEWWRLITPAFVHAEPNLRDLLSVLHFVFNFGAFRYLGPMIENRYGSWYFLGLSLLLAVLSNTAQYWVVDGNFVGMSGVIFGYFGFVWMRGRADPMAVQLPSNTVFMALAWLVLGFLGVMRMANWAHLGGLVVGVAAGFVSGKLARR